MAEAVDTTVVMPPAVEGVHNREQFRLTEKKRNSHRLVAASSAQHVFGDSVVQWLHDVHVDRRALNMANAQTSR